MLGQKRFGRRGLAARGVEHLAQLLWGYFLRRTIARPVNQALEASGQPIQPSESSGSNMYSDFLRRLSKRLTFIKKNQCLRAFPFTPILSPKNNPLQSASILRRSKLQRHFAAHIDTKKRDHILYFRDARKSNLYRKLIKF